MIFTIEPGFHENVNLFISWVYYQTFKIIKINNELFMSKNIFKHITQFSPIFHKDYHFDFYQHFGEHINNCTAIFSNSITLSLTAQLFMGLYVNYVAFIFHLNCLVHICVICNWFYLYHFIELEGLWFLLFKTDHSCDCTFM